MNTTEISTGKPTANSGAVFWITGLSGAGKTTLGTRLYYRLKSEGRIVVLLDGDVIKNLFSDETVDYSKLGRKKRAYQYSRLCRLLSDQGIDVVCCTIAMFHEVREWNRSNIRNYQEVYIDVDFKDLLTRDAKGFYGIYKQGETSMVGIDGDVELPKCPDTVIHNTMDNRVDEYIDTILAGTNHVAWSSLNYWNDYYKHAVEDLGKPSDFARFAMTYMRGEGGKLIDIGCGNGRDSFYFDENGLKVTAVDSSETAIRSIDEKKRRIFGICDNFVSAKALFCVDYDYCYARWSIHSVDATQQNELLTNIHGALREGGMLFAELRTVNDPKYGHGQPLGKDEFFLDGHYRRFIRPEEFSDELQSIGFKRVYFKESDEFSVVGNDRPMLLRVVATKGSSKIF
jgi:adenylylsulfate kinase-like enzyme/SAM-dependent methyltransferase